MDDNSEKLREQTKEKLRQGKGIDTSLYETNLKVLVEELSVYQIELEHQNQELIQAQVQLQHFNDRYLDLFDNAPIGYVIVDKFGVIKDINHTAAVLLERSKNEFVDTKITKFIHPDYQDIYYLYFQALTYQKQFQPCDIKLRKSNNNYFYARIQGVCQSREKDDEAEFRLALSDITVQKEMELKLLAAKALTEQSEERFQLLFNQAPLGYQSLDSDGCFIEVNQQWLDTLGYEREEVIGSWFGDFLTPAFKDGFRERFPIFKAQGHIHSEFEMMHKNGSILFIAFDGKIGTDIDGNFKQTHCILQDITEIKITQNALLEAEWKFKALFELGPIGVAYHRMIYDDSGKPIDYYFIDANASYNELTGVNPKGMTVRQAFPGIENDPFDWIGKFGHVAKTGETMRFEQYLESNQRWYDCVGYQYQPDHFVAAFNEITQQKHIEQELIKAKERAEESDLLKSAFLANMSHEIRTPMNGILGFAELLKEPELSGEQQQQYIKIIEKSGARMLNIINDIIDISKIEAGLMNLNLIETNINENIEELYTFFKPEVEAKGIELSFNTPLSVKDATITTDREKVYAIFTNLVKNAIKYTNHGKIELGYQKRGDYLEFYVKDTGIGVAINRQEAIFERFIQADISDKMARQGAGLGLAITRAYIEMLGGKIWVDSREGIGSTFYFTLPYCSEQKEITITQPLAISNTADELRKLKILIAEDDEVSVMLLEKSFKKISKEILNARTGLEAVDACKKNSDIELVLMDVQMPEMGGYEAASQIRAFNKEVIIIAQTANALTGDREKAVEAGCDDYIAKPINKADLFALIHKYFGN